MTLYRIGDCNYIKDLTGKGAALYGARWNSKNTYMLYTAQSASLALLEAVVHIGKLPVNNYCMATIWIPDTAILQIKPKELPTNWNTYPAPDVLKKTGDEFVKEGKYLAMAVPSVLMDIEYNYLLNPAHTLYSKVKITSLSPLKIDERVLKATT
jgi:RES domain-containing protein